MHSNLHFIENRYILGVHALSGNDFVSSFMRKGKKMFWNSIKEDVTLLTLFWDLGAEINPSKPLLESPEKFV